MQNCNKELCNQCHGLGCMQCAGRGFVTGTGVVKATEDISVEPLPACKDTTIYKEDNSGQIHIKQHVRIEQYVRNYRYENWLTGVIESTPGPMSCQFTLRLGERSECRFQSTGVLEFENSEIVGKWRCQSCDLTYSDPQPEYEVGTIYEFRITDFEIVSV